MLPEQPELGYLLSVLSGDEVLTIFRLQQQ